MNKKDLSFATRAIHVGNEPDPVTGSISPPIHLTTTYEQEGVGKHRGFDYSRAVNPTRSRWEENAASLDGGKHGFAFSSGMAATTTLFQLMRAGDHVLISHNVYGGTFRVIDQVLKHHGIEFEFINMTNLDNFRKSIKPDTRLVLAETPTNPMLDVVDIKGLAAICREKSIKLAIDSTFLSPYGQRPLELGADIVMHSSTKHLGGHSDVTGGILITSDEKIAERIKMIQKSVGAVPNALDCWLLLRSSKTLEVRVAKADANARKIAEFLAGRQELNRVIYPGLTTHPQHELARAQQRTPTGEPFFGSIISIEFSDLNKRDRFLKKLNLFILAESLGGVESLISNPYVMTHGAVPVEDKMAMGLTEGLIRLSIGIEAVEDLIADLENALA